MPVTNSTSKRMEKPESGESMRNAPSVAPYGTWRSPLTPELLTQKMVDFEEVLWDQDTLYWLEIRPTEEGRQVLMKEEVGQPPEEILPAPWNVRNRVHEYGGGAFAVHQSVVYFSHFEDQRLYRMVPGSLPEPLTAPADVRYADLIVDASRNRLIAVREDHRTPGQVTNSLVAIPLNASNTVGEVLAQGHDFYMFPRLSPDGSQLAWICWDYPNMPWDATQLETAAIGADGQVIVVKAIAGGPDESIFQPSWSPNGQLYFISDRTGWWNLYRWRDDAVSALTAVHGEFGEAAWIFGMSTYGFLNEREVLATYLQGGQTYLIRLDVETREFTHQPCPWTAVSCLKVCEGHAVMIAASDRSPASVAVFDAETKRYRLARRSAPTLLDEDYVSLPEPVEFPTENHETAHAFYYPPKNGEYIPPEGELPPLVVFVHGGPTSYSPPVFRLSVQYWTTRGFAVLDVNYGGSTGYGRAYRNRLRGGWGLVDVDDVVNAAAFLARHSQADSHRMVIRGGSAGGFTTLAALTFRDVFRGGASYFGVSDLRALALETHKFEAHYLDRLVGPLDSPTDPYTARSPLHHADSLNVPVIFFQGLDDHVVPPAQAQTMADSLRRRGVPVAHLTFPGEGHGFVTADTIIQTHQAELAFYAKILGIRIPDRSAELTLDNWPQSNPQQIEKG